LLFDVFDISEGNIVRRHISRHVTLCAKPGNSWAWLMINHFGRLTGARLDQGQLQHSTQTTLSCSSETMQQSLSITLQMSQWITCSVRTTTDLLKSNASL